MWPDPKSALPNGRQCISDLSKGPVGKQEQEHALEVRPGMPASAKVIEHGQQAPWVPHVMKAMHQRDSYQSKLQVGVS